MPLPMSSRPLAKGPGGKSCKKLHADGFEIPIDLGGGFKNEGQCEAKQAVKERSESAGILL